VSKDDRKHFQINAYLLARQESAKRIRLRILEKFGVDIGVEFVEELIELMALAAIEGLKIQNQIFTFHINKIGDNDDEPPEDPDETKH
jgi:hypothetical protein|tara:strand:+ start:1886 stop:2149 length:264 start_codon:yes stop_codon:yes gene_type:complete